MRSFVPTHVLMWAGYRLMYAMYFGDYGADYGKTTEVSICSRSGVVSFKIAPTGVTNLSRGAMNKAVRVVAHGFDAIFTSELDQVWPVLKKVGAMAECDSLPKCGGACADSSQFSFVMAFQPVVDIVAGRVYGHEALVRGVNGESASTVLAQVTEANRYAFDQACRVQAIETAARLGLDRRLNINFMPNAVYHPEACLRLTLATARENGFPLNLITFEFTEDERIIDRAHLKGIVETYRQHGFLTALDDFGAGYAGLSLLAEFQPDIIKIDRCLVDGVDSDKPRQAIVSGLLKTAEMLGLSVVAEGVERPEEVATLQEMGIRLFQGFLFARPAIERLIGNDEIAW